MRDQLAAIVGRALLLTLFAALGCASPTAVDAPFELLLEQRYTFACGAWTPARPPVERTLLDLRLSQIGTAGMPASEFLAAVKAAGGRVVYRFHGPQVRVELDVAAVPRLAGLNSAVTGPELQAHDVSLIVMLAHDLTDADVEAVQALGGRVTRRFEAIEGYVVVIDDARVPAVRALPGVLIAGFDGMGCLDARVVRATNSGQWERGAHN